MIRGHLKKLNDAINNVSLKGLERENPKYFTRDMMNTAHLMRAVQSDRLPCGNGGGGAQQHTQDLGELQLPQHPQMHSAENHGEGHVLLRTREASLGAQEGSGSCRKTGQRRGEVHGAPTAQQLCWWLCRQRKLHPGRKQMAEFKSKRYLFPSSSLATALPQAAQGGAQGHLLNEPCSVLWGLADPRGCPS